MLTPDELAQAQRLIDAASPGIYEVKDLYGQEWAKVLSPTTFGKRFKQSVVGGQLKGIRYDSTRGDNHKLYEVE
ncbi:DUF1413 domain-containing protein [Hydrogenophaga sp. SNF1]|uniref:DUF1413 domain-containing protein n=1 Tax=Hydrogenophaga sp. SNF1 TaxID=3098762 RepID=UPI002ACBF5F8|nr:DUF1413 domain-containing protein [Hydrogenophaga sp. SNF1]WQB82179.1 DUF1413 domain-containing protein [Hydrogenophaga sp. SNF1]